ncbi:hypothetical protein COJ18_27070 [Bacillus cereus]|uniref:hypothetical protein n=1 Tax=Bacillus cereus TaxID=1396 RepID=UPI000BF45983|nr:hypothetical protein [Bacillus cereus]PFK30748.1 hypothetical protein COJ18_27070 [Bacillus cereus]
MAILLSEVTKEQICSLIESEGFKEFHASIRREFDIDDIEYEFLYRDQVHARDGYVDTSINARVIINRWDHITELVLVVEGLIQSINSKFSKVPGKYFERVIELSVKFALVHELVHVKQFKNGKLTKKRMEEMKSIPYEKREVEIEANTIAKEVMGRNNEFDRRIIRILTSNDSIDNDNLHGILELFGK